MSLIRICYYDVYFLQTTKFYLAVRVLLHLNDMYDSAILGPHLMMPSAFCSDPSLLFTMYFLFATSLISFGDYLSTLPF